MFEKGKRKGLAEEVGNRQRYRRINRQAGREAGRQVSRQADRQAGRQAGDKGDTAIEPWSEKRKL